MADASRFVDVGAEEASSEDEEGWERREAGQEDDAGREDPSTAVDEAAEDLDVDVAGRRDGNDAPEKGVKFVDDLDEEEEEEESDSEEEDGDEEPKKRKRDEEELELDEDDYALLAEQGVVVRDRRVTKDGIPSDENADRECCDDKAIA